MAQVTISEAIRQSGIGRTRFYKLINNGTISTSVTTEGKKCIDTSELVRVFPDLGKKTTENSFANSLPDNCEQLERQIENRLLREQLRIIKEQLDKSEQREKWLQEQNANLLLRIEPPKPVKRENWLTRFWNGKDE